MMSIAPSPPLTNCLFTYRPCIVYEATGCTKMSPRSIMDSDQFFQRAIHNVPVLLDTEPSFVYVFVLFTHLLLPLREQAAQDLLIKMPRIEATYVRRRYVTSVIFEMQRQRWLMEDYLAYFIPPSKQVKLIDAPTLKGLWRAAETLILDELLKCDYHDHALLTSAIFAYTGVVAEEYLKELPFEGVRDIMRNFYNNKVPIFDFFFGLWKEANREDGPVSTRPGVFNKFLRFENRIILVLQLDPNFRHLIHKYLKNLFYEEKWWMDKGLPNNIL